MGKTPDGEGRHGSGQRRERQTPETNKVTILGTEEERDPETFDTEREGRGTGRKRLRSLGPWG